MEEFCPRPQYYSYDKSILQDPKGKRVVEDESGGAFIIGVGHQQHPRVKEVQQILDGNLLLKGISSLILMQRML